MLISELDWNQDRKSLFSKLSPLFIIAISLILGWAVQNPFSLKFKELFIFTYLLIAPFLFYKFFIKISRFRRLFIISLLILIILTSSFSTLTILENETEWVLSKEYVSFINHNSVIINTGVYISDPVSNYIISTLTSAKSAFYSRRSNPSNTCKDLVQYNIESNNKELSNEISNYFNIKEPNFEVLKKNNVTNIIFDRRYISECGLKSQDFERLLSSLEVSQKLIQYDCTLNKEVCIYQII
jgi:hypothetical protein